MRASIRKRIDERLEGLVERLRQHEAERAFERKRLGLHKLRRAGNLETAAATRELLGSRGYKWAESEVFGVRRFSVAGMHDLLYGPNGRLIGWE